MQGRRRRVHVYSPQTRCGFPAFRRPRDEAHGKALRGLGGLRVTLPNRRKGEPFKDRIVRMLETGKSPGRIALELGVTERYVRILARQVKKQPKPQVQLRLW